MDTISIVVGIVALGMWMRARPQFMSGEDAAVDRLDYDEARYGMQEATPMQTRRVMRPGTDDYVTLVV